MGEIQVHADADAEVNPGQTAMEEAGLELIYCTYCRALLDLHFQ